MSRASRAFRLTGKTIKFLFSLLIFSVIALLLWRVFSSDNPKSMENLTVNDKLYSAYEQKGDDLYLFRQEQNIITRAEHNSGYFAVTECVFIPDANQIQIVFRYNNSTIRHLAEDYALPETPSREAELFDVTLTLATDLTPDVTEDNAGNDPESVQFTRVHPVSVSSDTKNLYNFRRLVFDLDEVGLSLEQLIDSGLLLAVYADVYYNQDIRYEENAYGTLCLYDYVSPILDAELTRADRKALENYK